MKIPSRSGGSVESAGLRSSLCGSEKPLANYWQAACDGLLGWTTMQNGLHEYFGALPGRSGACFTTIGGDDMSDRELVSTGFLCQHCQVMPSKIEAAVETLGLDSALVINGVKHYSGDQ